jgi:hypothetical protein
MSYYIVEIDGRIHSAIDVENKPNKYGKPKIFKTLEDAKRWIEKRSYKGMSVKYDIMEVPDGHR